MESTGSDDQDWKGKKGKKGDEGTPALVCGGGVELPSDQYFIADGLCVRAVATNLGLIRQIAFAPSGDLYGVTRDGVISRFRDVDLNGQFDDNERQVFAQLDGIGSNVEIDKGGQWLYAGGASSVKRFALAQMPCVGSEAVITGIPSGGQHPLHTVRLVGHWLYVHSGSSANAIAPMSPDYDTNRSVIRRFDLDKLATLGRAFDWSEGEIFTKGVRNTVGIRADALERIYAVDNGIDDLSYKGTDIHAENPGDSLLMLQSGAAYGYPYCFGALEVQDSLGNFFTPGTMLMTTAKNLDGSIFTSPRDDQWCSANSMKAETLMPAHTAPLDLVFNDGALQTALPSSYANGAFVTLHGSWNRPEPMGYEVVFMSRDQSGHFAMPSLVCADLSFSYKVIFGGGTPGKPSESPWSWSNQSVGETLVRPVGVAISPIDGSLWVASDNAPVATQQTPAIGQGALYRIQSAEKKSKK